jgi:O-antigen/teichoic acid export membrane protein
MRLTRVGTNIVANYVGNVLMAVLSLIFIPLYIKFLGIGGYGLVGFFLTLQAVFSLLDLGLSTTLNRSIAVATDKTGLEQETRDLLRTLEIIYWCVAVLIGIIVLFGAPVIATRWLRSSALPPSAVRRSLSLMGVAIALQWPAGLYSGGLQGLQRQVLLNGINVFVAVVRGVGAVLVLVFVSATVPAYFVCQIFASAIQTIAMGGFLWHSLPPSERRAVFRFELLRGIYRFAAGVVGIGVLATILTQLDKLILSKVLTLEEFGYYSLAGVAAASLYRFIGPVFSAVFPRLSQAAEQRDEAAVAMIYHKSAQIIAATVLPAAAVIIAFAPELLYLWTGSAVTAERTSTILRLLLVGSAINGLLNIPYALQLAYQWTSLSFYMNIASVLIIGPGTWFAATHFGGVGAAALWAILNVGYLAIGANIMFRRLLRREREQWYVRDVGLPLLVTAAVVLLGRLLWMHSANVVVQVGTIALTGLVAVSAAVLVLPEMRSFALQSFRWLRGQSS